MGLQWSNECSCGNRYATKGNASDADCGITLDANGRPDPGDNLPDCGSGANAASLGICGWRNAVSCAAGGGRRRVAVLMSLTAAAAVAAVTT